MSSADSLCHHSLDPDADYQNVLKKIEQLIQCASGLSGVILSINSVK